MGYQDTIGFRELPRRAGADVARLPPRLVYGWKKVKEAGA